MNRKLKISSNKTPNRYWFWLQFSSLFPRFRAIGFRFAAFFFEDCFAFVPRFLCFKIDFFLGAWFRFDFILLLFTGVIFYFFFSFVSSVVIFIPARKHHFEKISSMGETRQIIYLRLITQMSLKKKRSQFSYTKRPVQQMFVTVRGGGKVTTHPR